MQNAPRVSLDALLAKLRMHPAGLTSAEVSTATGLQVRYVSSRLGKAFCYGLCDRQIIRTAGRAHGGCRYVLWLPLPATSAAATHTIHSL